MGRKYRGEEGKWEERRGAVPDSHGPLLWTEEGVGRALWSDLSYYQMPHLPWVGGGPCATKKCLRHPI